MRGRRRKCRFCFNQSLFKLFCTKIILDELLKFDQNDGTKAPGTKAAGRHHRLRHLSGRFWAFQMAAAANSNDVKSLEKHPDRFVTASEPGPRRLTFRFFGRFAAFVGRVFIRKRAYGPPHVVRVVSSTKKRPIFEDVPLLTESNAIHGFSRIDTKWLVENPIQSTPSGLKEEEDGSILKLGGEHYYEVMEPKGTNAAYYFSEY